MIAIVSLFVLLLLIGSISPYKWTTTVSRNAHVVFSNTIASALPLTSDELELVRVISARETSVNLLDDAMHRIINEYYHNNNFNLTPSKIWMKLIRSINRIIVYSNASSKDKERAMSILVNTLESFTEITPTNLKLNDIKAIFVMISHLNASNEINKRLVRRFLPLLLQQESYSTWNEIVLNLCFQTLISYDYMDTMMRPHTTVKTFLESNPCLMRLVSTRTIVILLQHPRLCEADIAWIYSLTRTIDTAGAHELTLVNNSYIGALLRHNTSTSAPVALQVYGDMLRSGSVDVYTINSLLGHFASLKFTASNHNIIGSLCKALPDYSKRKGDATRQVYVDIYTTLINYYSSKDVRNNVNNWFDAASSYAVTALEYYPSNTSNIIRPMVTSFASYWRSYDAVDSADTSDGNDRSLHADCSVIQSILEYTKDTSLWSIAVAAPLSRGEFRLAHNLLHSYRKASIGSNFDSVRTASKLLELCIYQAIDPTLNVLNPATKNTLVNISDVSISVTGIIALLSNTTQLKKTDLRTSLTLGDVVSFLEYCVLPWDGDASDEVRGSPSRDKLPIGINTLNRVFVDAIDNRQYSSGAKILRILEKASRLVLDMDKDSFSNHYLNRTLSAASDFSVNQVKDTIARRWTALLVGKSIKSIQSNFLKSMKAVK